MIIAIAGVNGAGKSSILGESLIAAGYGFFNSDLAAKRLRQDNPRLTLRDANSFAWQFGLDGLKHALATSSNYAFETTLGARTITQTLVDGAQAGAQIEVHYTGLDSPERHIDRVAARVAKGGHPIPAEAIRKRFDSSRENLIRLLPHLSSLLVYDNSAEADPALAPPEQMLILQVERRQLVRAAPPDQVPQWARAIFVAVHKLYAP